MKEYSSENRPIKKINKSTDPEFSGPYSVLSKNLVERTITFNPEYRGQRMRAHALEDDGGKNFEIFTEKKKQFIVSELAVLLKVPVSPIFKDEKLQGWFSEDVEQSSKLIRRNSEYEAKFNFALNSFILRLVVNDGDHTQGNYKDGIFFDFESATIYFSEEKIKELKYFLGDELEMQRKYIEKSRLSVKDFFLRTKQRVKDFSNELSDEGGAKFMKALLKKAEYKEHNSEEIRLSILKWTDILLVELDNFLKTNIHNFNNQVKEK